MVKNQADTDSFSLVGQSGRGTGGVGAGGVVAAAVVAAAVGAGVALLLAPDTGSKTRKRLGKRMRKLEFARQLDELQLGKRAATLGSGAADGWKRFRKQGARRLDPQGSSALAKPLYAVLGTLAGAAVAVLLAPDSGTETRQRIGRKFQEIKTDASTRWEEHRAARRTMESARGAARGDAKGDTNGQTDRDRNVRSVQELGREGSEVF